MPTTRFSHDPRPMAVTSWTARPSVRSFLFLLSIAMTTGCEVPNFEGPQLQSPPEGFRRKPDISQDRRMFPERASIHFDAWFLDSWGEFTGIYINGHEGTTTLEEVAEARLSAMANPPDHPMAYGDIEVVEVDGRTGWAWMDMWRDNGLHEVRYHAAIPYDTITYTVDMWTGDPTFKMRPDSIRAIVASFAVGRTRWNLPLLTISAVLGALLLRTGWSKLQRRPYENVRHMTLAQLPVHDAEDPTLDDPLRPPAGLPGVEGTE